MSIDKLIDKLTDTEKRRLSEAETPEELDALLDGGVELSDDALGAVAGGCFRPNAPRDTPRDVCAYCGMQLTKEEILLPYCPYCGEKLTLISGRMYEPRYL